jgi:hypothetical protein
MLEVYAMIRFQRRCMIGLVCMFMGTMGLFATAQAVEFAGGTGEPNDPYQIATAKQLLSIDKDKALLQKHYILINTIDLADTPVYGNVFRTFTGSFDGNGYTIQNFGSEEIPVGGGLFARIGSGGEVKNLGIVHAHVQSQGVLTGTNDGTVRNCYCTGAVVNDSSGGLIEYNGWGATVTDCYSEAEVSGPNNVGGLMGSNSGMVSRCHSSGKVTGLRNVGGLIGVCGGEEGQVSFCYSTSEVTGINYVGGLIGYSLGVVSDCHSSGSVTGTAGDTGGLIGYNRGTISSCYSTSQVTGTQYVGGLVGTNAGYDAEFIPRGRISSCYADANVVSEDPYAGGLVGYNWAASVKSCYSTGVVTSPDYAGGLVGYSDSDSRIVTSYSVARPTPLADSLYIGGLVGDGTADNSYFLAPSDGGGPDNGIGVPLTDAEMKQQASFVDWDFSATADDGEADLWFMPENAYPILIWQAEVTDPNDNTAVPDGA